MPVPFPTAVPAGYTLVAFEATVGHMRGVYGGNAAGLSRATDTRPSLLTAVAWWIDAKLDECEDGRERLVSRYDAAANTWSEWVPEARIEGRSVRAIATSTGAGVHDLLGNWRFGHAKSMAAGTGVGTGGANRQKRRRRQ